MMLGAIVGDIVGSRFEFNNHRNKNFELFSDGCFATDDSVMSLAIAKAIMEASGAKPPDSCGYDHDFHAALSDLSVKYMREIGRKYPNCGFGGMFHRWIFSDNPKPYNSFGNGAAMRVSPAGFVAADTWEAACLAETVTKVTHNHEEGIKGAQATSVAIAMARQGALKSEIRECVVSEYYPLDFKIADIRGTYRFNETCQETVPQAIECFLEATSFEDAIRTAISLGGDSDTIGAITGAIAEAYYGVPADIKVKALGYLDEELRAIYDAWERFAPTDNDRFKVLTKYISKISDVASLGEWIVDTENEGTPEHPIRLPYVHYSRLAVEFEQEFYQFSEAHPEYILTDYSGILEENGLTGSGKEIRSADLNGLDEQGVLALIMFAIRAERFCDGALLGFFEDGVMLACLKRLKDMDWRRQERQIRSIEFKDGGFFDGYATYRLTFNAEGAELRQSHRLGQPTPLDKTQYAIDEAAALKERFAAIHTEHWKTNYTDPSVCDGEQWSLVVRYSDGYTTNFSGSNAYPENWDAVRQFFGMDEECASCKILIFPESESLRSEVERLRSELSNLVLEEDQLLYQECKNIEMAYMIAVGGLECRVYELECAVLRLKRKVELIQARKNRQELIVLPEIERILDDEFATYQAEINERIDKMNAAFERSRGRPLSEDETREMKRLYRVIVKALHPDLTPDLPETKIHLFQNALEAYKNGDLESLKLIEAIVSDATAEVETLGLPDFLMAEKARLTKLLEVIKERIELIRSDFPYTMKDFVRSPKQIELRKAELERRIQQLRELKAFYAKKIGQALEGHHGRIEND